MSEKIYSGITDPYSISQSQLDSLISLAEGVSDDVKNMKTEMEKLKERVYLLSVFLGCFVVVIMYLFFYSKFFFDFPLTIKITIKLIALSLAAFGIFYIANIFRKIRKTSWSLVVEREVLEELMVSLYELENFLARHDFHGSDFERIMLKIRLKRLKLSV